LFDSFEYGTFLFFILGSIFGSFANVVIYRLPLGLSVVRPRSRCQKCGTQVAWYDNIPIASWFLLRGRCRHCQAPYSFRYVIVEFLMGVGFALSFQYFGLSWSLLESLTLVFGLVTCSFIDLDHMILPDEFTLSGIVLGLLFAMINPERSFVEALIGFLIGGGSLWLLAWLYFVFTKKDGLGGGDIKLLAWLGAFLGWKAIPFIIMFAAISGSFVGIAVGFHQGKGLKAAIPFGPFLAAGALIYHYGGQGLANWYIELFLPSLV